MGKLEEINQEATQKDEEHRHLAVDHCASPRAWRSHFVLSVPSVPRVDDVTGNELLWTEV